MRYQFIVNLITLKFYQINITFDTTHTKGTGNNGSGKKVENNKRRIKTVEEAIVWLTDLTGSHVDRLEKFLFGLDELRGGLDELRFDLDKLSSNIDKLKDGQRETQEKLNVLIDAQIRGEDKTRRLDEKMAELAEVVKFAHQRINKSEGN